MYCNIANSEVFRNMFHFFFDNNRNMFHWCCCSVYLALCIINSYFNLYWYSMFQLFRSSLQDHINSPLSRHCQLQQTMFHTLQQLHQDLERQAVPSREDPMFLRQMGLVEVPHKRLRWISPALSSSSPFFVWSYLCGCEFLLCRVFVGCICIEPRRPHFGPGPGGTSLRKIGVASSL